MMVQIERGSTEKELQAMVMSVPRKAMIGAGLLILLCTGAGCAGPSSSLTHDRGDLQEETCSPQQQEAKHNRVSPAACRPHRTWVQKVGDALSGAASAFRAPSP
jgi:hypothetical protein